MDLLSQKECRPFCHPTKAPVLNCVFRCLMKRITTTCVCENQVMREPAAVVMAIRWSLKTNAKSLL